MQDILNIAGVIFFGGMALLILMGLSRHKTETARQALHDGAARALTGGINNSTTVNVTGRPDGGSTEWPNSPHRSRPAEPDSAILAVIPAHVKACAVGAMNGTLPDSEGFYEWFTATEANFMPGALKKCPTNRLDVRAALLRFAEANVGLHMDAVLAQETKRA